MPRIFFSGLLLVCMSLPSAFAFAADSLYTRLGGKPVITQVIDQTIDSVARDPELNRSFDKVNIKRLNEKLVEQICSLAGGGCVYTGDDMKRVHQGLKISEREFYALVEALRKALDGNGIGEREKNELLSLLAPMKRLVVE